MASDSEKVNKAVKKILDSISVDVLKEEQRQILDAMLANKDCMAVLPTGFGKSLPFQIFLPVQWELNKSYKKKLIVCSPLVALMEDQVTKTSRIPHLTAAYRGSSPESDNLIKEGDVDVIFASPESLVGDPEWRSVVQQLEISAIVIDEFHTIATWGEDDGKKKAFRKWFSNLGELRSLCPSACVIALSATCTNKIRRRVTKVLHLMPNYVDIRISPNKPNIKIVCGSVPNTVDTALAWMVEGLSEKLEGFPRTVLYCNTIKDTSKVYSYFTDELPQLKEIIEMFHGSTPESTKKDILKKVTDKESNIRIIICTSALGMGVDLADFHSVIIYGCPEHSVDFIQEIGRVGRDGDSSVALVLNNSYHHRRVEKELKDAVKKDSDGCRRVEIFKSFLKDSDLPSLRDHSQNLHSCCDVCSRLCECGNCQELQLPLEKMFLQYGKDIIQSICDEDDCDGDSDEDDCDEVQSDHDSSMNSDLDLALVDMP